MATQTDSTTSPSAPAHPAAAAQPAAPTPLALRLPDEVWLLIFVDLDYCALKRAQRICKKVQRLIQVRSTAPRALVAPLARSRLLTLLLVPPSRRTSASMTSSSASVLSRASSRSA